MSASTTAVRIADGPDAGAIWHYGDPLGERPDLTVSGASKDLVTHGEAAHLRSDADHGAGDGTLAPERILRTTKHPPRGL